MKANSLRDLYLDELKDLYDSEHQIIKALPKMIDGASSQELRRALTEHLEITRKQAGRIERIFEQAGEKLKAEKCKGMEGLIKEGSEILKADMDGDVHDAAIIVAAQKVEHYEMAGYGSARTFANLLGEREAASILEETLQEEKQADLKLTEIAEQINVEAAETETKEVSGASRARSSTRRRRAA